MDSKGMHRWQHRSCDCQQACSTGCSWERREDQAPLIHRELVVATVEREVYLQFAHQLIVNAQHRMTLPDYSFHIVCSLLITG